MHECALLALELTAGAVSWAFDTARAKKLHGEGKDYGSAARTNDLIGCMVDCDRRAVSFLLNGTSLGARFFFFF
jgi:hypothetical protein